MSWSSITSEVILRCILNLVYSNLKYCEDEAHRKSCSGPNKAKKQEGNKSKARIKMNGQKIGSLGTYTYRKGEGQKPWHYSIRMDNGGHIYRM